MSEPVTILEEWKTFLDENWTWFVPMLLGCMGPIIGSAMGIVYDYCKDRGWVK